MLTILELRDKYVAAANRKLKASGKDTARFRFVAIDPDTRRFKAVNTLLECIELAQKGWFCYNRKTSQCVVKAAYLQDNPRHTHQEA